MISAIYSGWVTHRRLEPVGHAFRYRVFMPLVDLDELPELLNSTPGWSSRPWSPARLKREDFIGDPHLPIKQAVLDAAEEQTGSRPAGRVLMLANFRYFGFLINPISCYYCLDTSQQVQCIVAEVTNTPWGERQLYVIQGAPDPRGWLDARFDKAMHVSPFMPMAMHYHWRSNAPGDQLKLFLANYRQEQRVFEASLQLQRRGSSPATFTRYLALYPFMTLRIAASIYWQALRLWLKGTTFIPHPGKTKGEPKA